jgi:hypothetical protein
LSRRTSARHESPALETTAARATVMI